jgi:two-component system LytT family response regulator
MAQPLDLLALIVDDEAPARSALQRLLAQYCPKVKVVAQAQDVTSALESLEQTEANLVFLDITMPLQSGFDLVAQAETQDVAIIFTTAHSHYALEAFQAQALDYLLKPIDPTELERAVDRATEWLVGRWYSLQPQSVVQVEPGAHPPLPKRLTLPNQHGHKLIPFEEVEAVVADGAYATVVHTSGETTLVSHSLAELSRQLPEAIFYQVHRSNTVNLTLVREVQRTDGGRVVMQSGRGYPLARARRVGFESRLLS